MHPDLVRRLKALAARTSGCSRCSARPRRCAVTASGPTSGPRRSRRRSGTVNHVGAPNPLLAATVMDAEGPSSAPGVPGEAVYRSPAVTAGYYQDEDGHARGVPARLVPLRRQLRVRATTASRCWSTATRTSSSPAARTCPARASRAPLIAASRRRPRGGDRDPARALGRDRRRGGRARAGTRARPTTS